MGNRTYIRFGEIPIDEKSKVFYNGEYIVKEEDGISVFDCAIINNTVRLVLPIIVTSSALNCIDGFLYDYIHGDKRVSIYLVTGDLVGYGCDNEPLIRNVNIISKLEPEDLFDKSYSFDMESINEKEIPADKVYYIKLNDLNWYKSSKSFYEKFNGKKVISDKALAFPDKNVEELYNEYVRNNRNNE